MPVLRPVPSPQRTVSHTKHDAVVRALDRQAKAPVFGAVPASGAISGDPDVANLCVQVGRRNSRLGKTIQDMPWKCIALNVMKGRAEAGWERVGGGDRCSMMAMINNVSIV